MTKISHPDVLSMHVMPCHAMACHGMPCIEYMILWPRRHAVHAMASHGIPQGDSPGGFPEGPGPKLFKALCKGPGPGHVCLKKPSEQVQKCPGPSHGSLQKPLKKYLQGPLAIIFFAACRWSAHLKAAAPYKALKKSWKGPDEA